MKWRKGLLRDRRGNFATLTALAAPVVLAASAFAVDQGALYVERRSLQAAADTAAMAAAAAPGHERAAAIELLAANGFPLFLNGEAGAAASSGSRAEGEADRKLEVVLGHYVADPSLAPSARFTEGATPTNAVRVTASQPGTRYFAGLIGPSRMIVGASAVAAIEPQAAFSVGSRLAALDGGIANALLGALTGSSVSLSVMDYDALLSAKVDLLAMLGALNATLDLEAVTYRDVLDTQVSVGDLARAMAHVDGIATRARLALERLAGTSGGTKPKLALSTLLDIGADAARPLGQRSAVQPSAGATEIIAAAGALALANGHNQVSLDLGVAVPGLLSAKVLLAIGEPAQRSPWLAVGAGGEMVRTTQTRPLLDVAVGGPGGLLGSVIRLPVYVELASAEARLASIRCANGKPSSIQVGIDARPGLARVMIAEPTGASLADFSREVSHAPAKLISLPLISVTASADIEVANGGFRRVTFDRDDIDDLTVKTVATTSLATSLTSSLLGETHIDVRALGLGLGLPTGLSGTIAGILGSAAPAVDKLLFSVLDLLGVSIGEADLRVHGASCGRPYLVQ